MTIVKKTKVESINLEGDSVGVRVSMSVMEGDKTLSVLPPHRAVFRNTNAFDAEINGFSDSIPRVFGFPPPSEDDIANIRAVVALAPNS